MAEDPISQLSSRLQRTLSLAEGCQEKCKYLFSQVDISTINDPHNVSNLHLFQSLRKITSTTPESDINYGQLAQTSACPQLVAGLKAYNNENLRYEAYWFACNLCYADDDGLEALMHVGIIDSLLTDISESSSNIKELGFQALGNIAGTSPQWRNILLDKGVMTSVGRSLDPERTSLTTIQQATWCLCNLVREKPSPALEHMVSAFEMVVALLPGADQEVLENLSFLLAFLTEKREIDDHIIASNITPCLVSFISERNINNKIKSWTLRSCGNLLVSSPEITQLMINCGIITALGDIIQQSNLHLVKDALWALSSIASGDRAQVEALTNHAKILSVVKEKVLGDDREVGRQATWVFVNIASTRQENVIWTLVKSGLLASCEYVLRLQDDEKIISLWILILRDILNTGKSLEMSDGYNPFILALKEAGIVAHLEALQHCPEAELSAPASDMIKKYRLLED